MIDHRAVDLHTAGGKVTLEIVGIVLCIPEAPFRKGEKGEALFCVTLIAEDQLLHFPVVILGDKEGEFRLQAVLLTADHGITHTVTAFIGIQLRLYR